MDTIEFKINDFKIFDETLLVNVIFFSNKVNFSNIVIDTILTITINNDIEVLTKVKLS